MLNKLLNQYVDKTPKKEQDFVTVLGNYVPLYEDQENAKLITANDYQIKNAERTYRYSELKGKEINGFPICVKRNTEGELCATFTDDIHALVVGATRSGKSTGFVLPFLNLMPLKKNKPSIVLSDPKGELYRGTHKTFEDNGYRVIVLDFINYLRSDCWNPLTKIYRKYQEYLNVSKEVKTEEENGSYFHVFRGERYNSRPALTRAIDEVRDALYTEVDNAIISIGEAVCPVLKDSDPYWEQMAATMLEGFLWAMLEDSDPKADRGGRPLITEDTYSFETVSAIFASFTSSNNELDDHDYFVGRNINTSKARRLVETSIVKLSANVTRSCIISSFLAKMKPFKDACVSRLTCANTFDIPSLADDERPTVIYVSYKDEDALHYQVISLFFSDLYLGLIDSARKKDGRLERPFYFLLDEFGNFPKFSSFENVISACGSRNIWFMLVVQSYAQLYRVYGKETAEIIIDNLNMHLYFGSNNHETKEAFSKECGRHTVLSPLSALNGRSGQIENYQSVEVPLVPVSKLGKLAIGEFFVTQMRGDVLLSFAERSYLCPEFYQGDNAAFRKAPVDFSDARYKYDLSWAR